MSKFLMANLVSQNNHVQYIPIDMLVPYHKHPFKLYSGERLNDMVESVRKNGILNPILVQPTSNGKYEILSGHNRVQSAKTVGLTTIPAVVKENLSEDEADVYVIETNLIQRGFNDLLISERASVLLSRHSKLFSQGKRNDIINELKKLENTIPSSKNLVTVSTSDAQRPKLENTIPSSENLVTVSTSDAQRPKLENAIPSSENLVTVSTLDAQRPKLENTISSSENLVTVSTSDAQRPKLENTISSSENLVTVSTSDAQRPKSTRSTLAKDYGLGTTMVSYLIRINYLIPEFKDMVDNFKLSLKAGVELSFLPDEVQNMVYDITIDNNIKLSVKLSKSIREAYTQNNSITIETLKNLMTSKNTTYKDKSIKISISKNTYSKYFNNKTSQNEIESTIQKALDMYFSKQN